RLVRSAPIVRVAELDRIVLPAADRAKVKRPSRRFRQRVIPAAWAWPFAELVWAGHGHCECLYVDRLSLLVDSPEDGVHLDWLAGGRGQHELAVGSAITVLLVGVQFLPEAPN